MMAEVFSSGGCEGEPVSAHFLHGFSQIRDLIGALMDGHCHPQRELFDEVEPMVDIG